VDKAGETQSHVYRGRVALRILAGEDNNNVQVIPLGENESARVTLDKGRIVKVIRDSGSDQAESFVRDMPKRVPIIKLFNTGVGLKEGDADPHWQIAARSDDPKFKPRQAVVTRIAEGIWVPNDPQLSQWISIAGDLRPMPGNVVYTFRTKLELVHALPGTCRLQLRYAADDLVREIRLNGRRIPIKERAPDERDYWMLQSCFLVQGFVEGDNTLEIDVENFNFSIGSGSPMGLMAVMEASALHSISDSSATAEKKTTKKP